MDIAYIIFPILLIAVVLASVWLEKWSVPVILVALGAGILFGSDFLNLMVFDDFILANQVANLALVFILFNGGLLTKSKDFRAVALPAGGLATWGVILTALVLFLCLHFGLKWPLELSILLSVIISSTDAAAIFSILRRQSLPPKLSSTVEIESAANDPMAVLLTTIAVASLTGNDSFGFTTILSFFWKFGVGPIIGFLIARCAVWIFNRIRTQDRGYYYILFIAFVLLMFGVSEMVQASGMLAVFTGGYVLGNSTYVHRQGVLNFSEAISTTANIGMFVLMGVLVFPKQFANIWFEGTLLFLILSFVARPVAVFVSTLGMGIKTRYKIFISWAGLRGAVPIVLATYPAAAGMGIANDVFNLVFFAVLLSIMVQGSSLGMAAKWLNLSLPARPKPLFNLELITMAHSDYDVVEVDLPGPKGELGPLIRNLNLPEGAVIAMITRGPEVVIPKGNTRLQGWDHVSVIAHAPDEDLVRKILQDQFVVSEDDVDS